MQQVKSCWGLNKIIRINTFFLSMNEEIYILYSANKLIYLRKIFHIDKIGLVFIEITLVNTSVSVCHLSKVIQKAIKKCFPFTHFLWCQNQKYNIPLNTYSLSLSSFFRFDPIVWPVKEKFLEIFKGTCVIKLQRKRIFFWFIVK